MNNLTVSQKAKFSCMYCSGDLYICPIQIYNYIVEATVSANQNFEDNGMILSFEQFKKDLNEVLFDKRFIVSNPQYTWVENHPKVLYELQSLFQYDLGVLPVNHVTSESILYHIAEEFQTKLNSKYTGVVLEEMKLYENSQSFSSWRRIKDNGWG